MEGFRQTLANRLEMPRPLNCMCSSCEVLLSRSSPTAGGPARSDVGVEGSLELHGESVGAGCPCPWFRRCGCVLVGPSWGC